VATANTNEGAVADRAELKTFSRPRHGRCAGSCRRRSCPPPRG
jgi:hypothetical protein